MEPVTWGFIGAIVGTIVGASASIITTLITGRYSRKLQQDAISHERSERAREFQRNNLLELQDVLSSHMRLVTRAHLEDIKSFRDSPNESQRPLLSDELDQELSLSNRRLTILTERVADDSLRESIKALSSEMFSVIIAKSESESNEAIQNLASMFKNTMESLGFVLRASY